MIKAEERSNQEINFSCFAKTLNIVKADYDSSCSDEKL